MAGRGASSSRAIRPLPGHPRLLRNQRPLSERFANRYDALILHHPNLARQMIGPVSRMLQAIWFTIGIIVGIVLTAALALIIGRRIMTHRLRAIRRVDEEKRLRDIPILTGGLAHEIKNPLSTLSLNAQLLEEDIDDLTGIDADDAARIRRRTHSLRRESDRLKDILTDFLQFAGQHRLDAQEHDLNVLIDELVDFFVPQTLAANINLRASLPSTACMARVDSGLLKQALLNLLLNASQALQSDARTESKTRELIVRLEPASPSAPRDSRNARHRIHITDTGPGIAVENQARIFQPYFTTRKTGTGLGLATTKRIIEEHGGTIELHSEPGRGTDFIIALPRAEDHKPPATAPASQA